MDSDRREEVEDGMEGNRSYQNEISDTEEMDDDDNDEEALNSDSEDVLFVPQPDRRQHRPLRIYDGEVVDVEGESSTNVNNTENEPIPTRNLQFRVQTPIIVDDEDSASSDYATTENDATDAGSSTEGRALPPNVFEPHRSIEFIASEDSEEGRISPTSDETMESNDSGTEVAIHSNVEDMHQVTFSGRADVRPPNEAGLGGSGIGQAISNASTSSVGKPPSPSKPSFSGREEKPLSALDNFHCDDDSGDDALTCPICFENWSNYGIHRIVSLKCGHLFGLSCIERWLRGGHGSSRCPQCKVKAHRRDIRVIYAKTLKVEDTTEKERLSKEVQRMKEEKERSEREKAQLRLRVTAQVKLTEDLQEEIRQLREAVARSSALYYRRNPDDPADDGKLRFILSLYHTFELIKNGSSRVMAFHEGMNMLVVSVPSQIDMFPGYGIKRINTLDLKVENFLHLHSKQIRDLAFNPSKNGWLLSVGFDKMAKITNVISSVVICSYSTNYPLWSCCWSCNSDTEFFVGTSIGIVYRFNTVSGGTSPVGEYKVGNSGPAVSISHIHKSLSESFFAQGILVTRFDSVNFIELNGDGSEVNVHPLPLSGTFIHTNFNESSMHFLASCRPNDRNFHARYFFCQLTSEKDDSDPNRTLCTSKQIHCFQGSTTMKVLSRAVIAPNKIDDLVAIFGEECTTTVKIYDVSSGSLIQNMRSSMNIIDILPVTCASGNFIAMLGEKRLRLYKWIPQR